MSAAHRFGYVAVIGRPNVGKSTFVNAAVGHKVSISSRRPQTTRHRLLGISSSEQWQIVFVDTPGLDFRRASGLDRAVQRTALGSLDGIDLVAFMIMANGWRESDERVLGHIPEEVPVILLINQVDRLPARDAVLPLIAQLPKRDRFRDIVPLSALTGWNLEHATGVIAAALPEGPPGFPAEQVSARSDAFMVAELVREQLFRQLGQELPYATAVILESLEEGDGRLEISAAIWVEKTSQKGIVIGSGGKRIRELGTRARQSIEEYLGRRVYLELWVRVREGWRERPDALGQLGYAEEG